MSAPTKKRPMDEDLLDELPPLDGDDEELARLPELEPELDGGDDDPSVLGDDALEGSAIDDDDELELPEDGDGADWSTGEDDELDGDDDIDANEEGGWAFSADESEGDFGESEGVEDDDAAPTPEEDRGAEGVDDDATDELETGDDDAADRDDIDDDASELSLGDEAGIGDESAWVDRDRIEVSWSSLVSVGAPHRATIEDGQLLSDGVVLRPWATSLPIHVTHALEADGAHWIVVAGDRVDGARLGRVVLDDVEWWLDLDREVARVDGEGDGEPLEVVGMVIHDGTLEISCDRGRLLVRRRDDDSFGSTTSE